MLYMQSMAHPNFRFNRRMVMFGATAVASAAVTRSASAISRIGDPSAPLVPAVSPDAAVSIPQPVASLPPLPLRPALLRGALDALARHAAKISHRDRIAIVDFAAPSSEPRLHFLDVVSGVMSRLLVTHGSGSDPGHTGFLQRFSNDFGSNASSQGAFVTGDYYVGKHGRSQRLIGLDPTNSNALDRAIVVHGAWYANADMIRTHGKLGRSQGCFAVGERDLDRLFGHLGEGRLIYAAKA